MPCYRCGTRQTDPDRGSSPWLRGVRADRQVLICPGCQTSGEWIADLDRCPVCASTRLVRRLGEAECRECGHVGESVDADSGTPVSAEAADGMTAPGLAEEVEQALARVLRRGAGPGGRAPGSPRDAGPGGRPPGSPRDAGPGSDPRQARVGAQPW